MEPPSEPLMDVLFASQNTSESQKILVHPDGTAYKIHLQVNGILQRPNLVRMLRKAGAHPSRPEDADIVLVDSSQIDGKRLIRTWHHTPGKAVLEFQWLRRSIEARKPLLGDDDWADAQTVDDGEAIIIDEIAADGEEAEVEQIVSKLVSRPQGDSPLIPSIRSPLPTPRVTPDESFVQRKINNIHLTLAADLPSMPNDPMSHTRQRQSPLVDIPQQQSKEHDAVQPAYIHAPSTSPPHQASNTPQPTSLHPQFIPALPYNSQAPPQTQLAQPATPPPFPHVQFSQTPQFPQPQFSQLAQFPQQFSVPQQSYQFSQLPVQQPPPGQMPFVSQPMVMPTGLPFSNLSDQQNFSMLMTLMDVLRNKNGGEFMQAIQPSPMHAHLEAASNAPPPIHHEQIPDSISYPPSSSSYNSRTRTPEAATSQRSEKKARRPARKPRREKYSRSPSRELLPPSVRRKVNHGAIQKTPENPPDKRSSKGKERAMIPHVFTSDEDVPTGSDDMLEAPLGLPSRKKAIAAKNNIGEVFLNDHGQPLSFFVQVDLQGRSGVVSNIKKHKGKITGSIADADYVILFARSQTFQGLLSEAQACDKVPIQSLFVADCIAENMLLDETDYALDTSVFVKQTKRGRPSGLFELAQVETPLSIKKERKPKKSDIKNAIPAETPAKKVTKKSAPTPSKKSAAPVSQDAKSLRARRSPTPPPPETRRSMKNGRFYFTQPELDYFGRYSQFLLDEDPTMSTSALLQAIHKKMPHHSTASWQAQVSSKLKTQLTDTRKRANVAYRKGTAKRVEKPTEEEKPGPSKKPRLAASLTAPTQSQEALEREDFEIICLYFANGGGDDDDDERVWAKLSQHRACKSAKSWPEYYTAHQTEVYAHIEELVRSSS
ncbi:hypothetical protein K503DRAFT_852800 [Rhizopogon vinicolor AM-OR11-026]|uniref:Uncharacterized protein n=1 Tax=Rhizopogon vinicolor AM-OR11-026 TaxID=1314800 RepID=A0A1B7NHG5_9AGAM|nr:hypothetical protein K503DRAFT_852800 [Rhizopogon vinicolor AM-OR11-026]